MYLLANLVHLASQMRILVPSSSAPPSSGTPGIWRRKSATGGVDAQGNLLVHPMTWLDERLFGWSRSAKRGTSVWGGGGNQSVEASRMPTPNVSDDEDDHDAGDYDDVLGYVSNYQTGGGRSRSKSLRNSYADLQQLKKADAQGRNGMYHSHQNPKSPLANAYTPSSPTGLQQRRERKGSLTDGVKVERLAALDPTETFKEATEDINREVRQRRASLNGDIKEE